MSNGHIYEASSINTWLNGDFYNSLGTVEQTTIKQVKIPTDQSGANGLSCKIFLLSGYEVGLTTNDNPLLSVDGAKPSYFESGTSSSAMNKRIAYLNGSAANWWLRSLNTDEDTVWFISSKGDYFSDSASSLYGIRPALILPSTALFDKRTKILKG